MAESIVTLSHSNVSDIVAQIGFSGSAFLILETLEKADVRPVLGMSTYVIVDTLKSGWNLNNYPAGRVFHRRGELKWQREGSRFHLVYIGLQPPQKLSLDALKPLPAYRDKYVYLWGQKVEKEQLQHEMGFDQNDTIFVELQIPQYLKYPVVPKRERSRIRIRVREFYTQTGQLEYYRFVKIVEAKS